GGEAPANWLMMGRKVFPSQRYLPAARSQSAGTSTSPSCSSAGSMTSSPRYTPSPSSRARPIWSVISIPLCFPVELAAYRRRSAVPEHHVEPVDGLAAHGEIVAGAHVLAGDADARQGFERRGVGHAVGAG